MFLMLAVIHNQSFQDLENMPSTKEVAVHEVQLIQASEHSLEGFGHIVRDFENEEVIIETWPTPNWRPVVAGTGNQGGVVEGNFLIKREGPRIYAHNHAVQAKYITGWFGDPANPQEGSCTILTHEANYHPDGGQVFYPEDGNPFVVLLAKPGDDIQPENFVAFYFDGSFGVQINPGVWHQPPFPANEEVTLKDKQGAVHACIGCDFVQEFNCYLAVPLKINL